MKNVFDITGNKKTHLKCKMFLDDDNTGIAFARFETVKYPRIQKFRALQDSFFWRPTEVDINRDKKDFSDLEPHEQHIFTSNLSRQILLDTIQGRCPTIAFSAIASLPEIEHFINAWQYFESIHSESYTHIIRNVYSDPSIVFDQISSIKEILDCADDISCYYNDLIHYNELVSLNGYTDGRTKYEHKKRLWLALNAVNILEGIRFYVSFACSWAFAEQKKMEGNAKIIKFICRDENLHLGFTQYVLTQLPKDDEDFVKIREETYNDVVDMFVEAAEQEKAWATYLFKDGSMIGLTAGLLSQYVEWITCKRMLSLSYKCPYVTQQANPLPWTEGWIAGKERQVAPQEVEVSSYTVGEIDKEVSNDIFKGMSF